MGEHRPLKVTSSLVGFARPLERTQFSRRNTVSISMADRELLLCSECSMFSYASLSITSDSSVTSFVCEKCKLVSCLTKLEKSRASQQGSDSLLEAPGASGRASTPPAVEPSQWGDWVVSRQHSHKLIGWCLGSIATKLKLKLPHMSTTHLPFMCPTGD